VDDAGEQEEEESSHQRKKAYQKKKEHPEYENDKNSGKEKETMRR
jgi:hypothetical protein